MQAPKPQIKLTTALSLFVLFCELRFWFEGFGRHFNLGREVALLVFFLSSLFAPVHKRPSHLTELNRSSSPAAFVADDQASE